MKGVEYYFLFCFCLLATHVVAQNRWTQLYYSQYDAYANAICQSYDKGSLLILKDGHNYVNYSILLKVDINGEVLWEKRIGENDSYTSINDIKGDEMGNSFLVGNTSSYSEDYDPFLVKINECGEKEWCSVLKYESNNYGYKIELLEDNSSVVLLRYMNQNNALDRIGLVKFSTSGEIDWINFYNSTDSNISNQDAYDITVCPDNGIFITGVCSYKESNPPHASYLKPYFVKADSNGDFKWEKVIHKDNTFQGGRAWSSELSPDSNWLYSSLSHKNISNSGFTPAILKMNLNGEQDQIFDLFPYNQYGTLSQFSFANDTMIIGEAFWGNGDSILPQAIKFNSSGIVYDSSYLIDDRYLSQISKTSDNKHLFFTNKLNKNTKQFDAYLIKLNNELESDTFYTAVFNYDSLCENSIEDDTISVRNCDIIVDIESHLPITPIGKLEIFPNPVTESVKIALNNNDIDEIRITDITGRLVFNAPFKEKDSPIQISVKNWRRGVYIVHVKSTGKLYSSKLIVYGN